MNPVARRIAQRVVPWLEDGDVVNLGIGIPTLVADCVPEGRGIVLQTENGMLAVGPAPAAGEEDPELVNAGKLPVTELPGASYFSSATSFGMIRGGHIDVAILGALQIDERGRVANWSLPGRPILGVGGAMDLMVGARRVIVATTHLTKRGEPKLVASASLPLTADRSVDVVVTEAASFRVADSRLELVEIAEDYDLEWVRANTDAAFRVAIDEGAELASGAGR